ncbi:IPT/TIG domain-containing protein, partial [Hymenobacter sp. B1770]|uniref:IPT/TIG domain-containing protein n=1 Tax=Hymenobacter sp. B1770 TaxID=1718788 RepID=UPI003CECB1D0
DFTGATAVRFNGVTAPGFVVNSATQITVNVPAGATSGNVTVTTPGGTSNGVAFAVTTPLLTPTLSSLSPTSGPVGTSVTLSGANLSGATGVSFNGTAQTTIGSNTATSLVVAVPAGATSGNVTVTTPTGTSNGLAFAVTVPQLVVSQGDTTYPSNGMAYGFLGQTLNTGSA